jgi:hypothetical protein
MGGGNAFDPLVSYKVANCEVRTEGSRTTNFGTDEQEPYMRHISWGKQAHLCNSQHRLKQLICRYGRNRKKEDVITWGDLQSHE